MLLLLALAFRPSDSLHSCLALSAALVPEHFSWGKEGVRGLGGREGGWVVKESTAFRWKAIVCLSPARFRVLTIITTFTQ